MHMHYKVDPDDALSLPSFRALYWLTAVVGMLVLADLLFWWAGYESWRNPWGINLSLMAAVLGGGRIVYGALAALLEGDVGADLALAIALLASLLLGEYWVGAEVVLIAMVGESLEALTFARTHREIHRHSGADTTRDRLVLPRDPAERCRRRQQPQPVEPLRWAPDPRAQKPECSHEQQVHRSLDQCGKRREAGRIQVKRCSSDGEEEDDGSARVRTCGTASRQPFLAQRRNW